MTLRYLIPLWLGPALQFALVLVILRRRVFLQMFPAFFRYTCFAVLAHVLGSIAKGHSPWYFWVYWTTEIIYGVLALLVMREIVQAVWDLKFGFRAFTVWIFILALASAATLWGLKHPDGNGRFSGMVAAIATFMAGVHTAEVALCCFVLWLVRKFNQYHIGIMLGFAASATVAVLAYIGHYYALSPTFQLVIKYGPLSAYMASTALWLLTFLSKPTSGGKFDPEAAIQLMRRQEEIAQIMLSRVRSKWRNEKTKDANKRSSGAPNGAPL